MGGFRRAASDIRRPANCSSSLTAGKQRFTLPCLEESSSRHHLFSQISRNWAGEPLTDIDKVLNLIRTTTTKTGLVVTAQLIADNYNKGIRITDAEMGCSTSYLTTLSVAGTTHYIPNRL